MTALPVVSEIDTDWERVCIEQPSDILIRLRRILDFS